MTKVQDAAGGILCCMRREIAHPIAHISRKLLMKKTNKERLEKPQADFDLSLGSVLSLSKKSTLTKKKDCDRSQCRTPLVIISGVAHLYGSCRKYVLRCSPVGWDTRSPFLVWAKLFHSSALARKVHMLLRPR
jgi:hypothetical protein